MGDVKNSVVFYRSYYDAIKNLEPSIRLEVIEAILEYSFSNEEPSQLSPVSQALFYVIKPTIDSSMKRYRASVENGKKGGNPAFKKGQSNPYYQKEEFVEKEEIQEQVENESERIEILKKERRKRKEKESLKEEQA